MMKNYFENQRVNWHQFSPKEIIFKSNAITKKLLPEVNIMSWNNKDSRHRAIAEKTGSTAHTYTHWQEKPYQWSSRVSYK